MTTDTVTDSRRVPSAEDEPTVTAERAFAILGISRSAGYAAILAGDIPTIRIGQRRVVVVTAALRKMLQLDDPQGSTMSPAHRSAAPPATASAS